MDSEKVGNEGEGEGRRIAVTSRAGTIKYYCECGEPAIPVYALNGDGSPLVVSYYKCEMHGTLDHTALIRKMQTVDIGIYVANQGDYPMLHSRWSSNREALAQAGRLLDAGGFDEIILSRLPVPHDSGKSSS